MEKMEMTHESHALLTESTESFEDFLLETSVQKKELDLSLNTMRRQMRGLDNQICLMMRLMDVMAEDVENGRDRLTELMNEDDLSIPSRILAQRQALFLNGMRNMAVEKAEEIDGYVEDLQNTCETIADTVSYTSYLLELLKTPLDELELNMEIT